MACYYNVMHGAEGGAGSPLSFNANNCYGSGSGTTDATPPTTPTGLTATAVSTSQINLAWTASTDTGGSGLAGYKIYRGGVQIATTAGTSYQNTGLTASTNYSYTVSAYDAAGNNSAQSGSVSATTQPPSGCLQSGTSWQNTSFPVQTGTFTAQFDATPSVLGNNMVIGLASGTASAYTSLAAIVRFNGSSTIDADNGGSGNYTAMVPVPYAAGSTYRGGTQIATVTGTSYTVSAYDAAGNNSAQSGSVGATTPGTTAGLTISNAQAASITTSGATITWTTNLSADSQVGYKVTGAASYTWTPCCAPTGVTFHSLALSGLTTKTVYHFIVESLSGSTLVDSTDQTFMTL
jgi:hypothetical protein